MKLQRSGVLKRIMMDYFYVFWTIHTRLFPVVYRDDIQETVIKIIRCTSPGIGYTKYECLECERGSKPEIVPFTCKSRYCNKCGRKCMDEWSDKQQELIFNLPHRRMVFTIPWVLRDFFCYDRKKLNKLSKQVVKVFQFYYQRKSKKRDIQTDIITVIHNFGRDLKFNL